MIETRTVNNVQHDATISDMWINGRKDTWWDSDCLYGNCLGVRMGDGFLDALGEPPTPKEYITDESRLEHGKRYMLYDNMFLQSREVTLTFTIEGRDCKKSVISGMNSVTENVSAQEDFTNKKRAFMHEMTRNRGYVTIQVPDVFGEDVVFHLIYTGKGSEFATSADRTFCKMMLKFIEPNPASSGLWMDSFASSVSNITVV